MPLLDTAHVKRHGAGGLTNVGSFATLSDLLSTWPNPQSGLFAGVWFDGVSDNQSLYTSDNGTWSEVAGAGGSGDMIGAASSTDNAIIRWDGTDGKHAQDSLATVDDSGNVTLNTLKLSASPTVGSPVIGQLYINSAENGLPEVKINTNSSLTIGAEFYVQVVNKTGAPLVDGTVVYIASAQGNRPTAVAARANAASTSRVIGIVTGTIADNAEGFATVLGDVHSYDTSGFSAGDTLYLSAATPGALTNVAPTSPNYVVVVGKALNSTVNGTVHVRPEMALAANSALGSDALAPTQAAVKTYVDSGVSNETNKTLNDQSNYIDANAIHIKTSLNLGGAATIGMPVYATTWNAGNGAVQVSKARANAVGTLAVGLCEFSATDGTISEMRTQGVLTGVNTNAWSEGTVLYVSDSVAGTLTATAPVSVGSYVQKVAVVLRQHATLGELLVAVDGATLNQAAASGGFVELSMADYQGPAVVGMLGRYTSTRVGTLGSIRLVSDTLPVGSNLIAELRKNSPTSGNVLSATLQITTTEAATNGQYIGTVVSSFSSTAIAVGDVFYLVLTSVGSTTPAVNARAILYAT